MSRNGFDETEKYLLEHWTDAHRMELAMEETRTKYTQLNQRVIDKVLDSYPAFDLSGIFVTQFWGDGSIGVGRKMWANEDNRWPSGIWVDRLRLELLSDPTAPSPTVYVWMSAKAAKKYDLELVTLRRQLVDAAKQRLAKDDLPRLYEDSDATALVTLNLAVSKTDLLKMLLNNDDQGYTNALFAGFESLSPLIGDLDALIGKARI